ncbi:FAD:protein FMN transferase [Bifidobacterium phasiani]|nr:FAD:protein FMN transferase [Bifidobacterium phasiani]
MKAFPHTLALPQALGTGIIIRSTRPIPPRIRTLAADYESVLSRFRADSTLAAMAAADRGGSFDFPGWAEPLFALYDRLYEATDGAVDPCIGEALIRLGYGADYALTSPASPPLPAVDTMAVHAPTAHDPATCDPTTHDPAGRAPIAYAPDARIPTAYGPATCDSTAHGPAARASTVHAPAIRIPATHGPIAHAPTAHNPLAPDTSPAPAESPTSWSAMPPHPTWRDDVERHGATLVTRRAVHLDFGACGKGYLLDLIARTMGRDPAAEFVIDAGGDLLVRTDAPITIALEDPHDTTRAVGTAAIASGAFCASAPSRRHWATAAGEQVHHLLSALDGAPVDDVAATWASVGADSPEPTPAALADGLATALFVADPARLAKFFRFECVVLRADRTALRSRRFPGDLFIGA